MRFVLTSRHSHSGETFAGENAEDRPRRHSLPKLKLVSTANVQVWISKINTKATLEEVPGNDMMKSMTCESALVPARLTRVCIALIVLVIPFALFTLELPIYPQNELPVPEQGARMPASRSDPLPNTRFTAKFPVKRVLQSLSSPLKWALDDTDTMRYIGDGSVFGVDTNTLGKSYRTLAGYQQCLANKHIVMMGDSRVRYQFMALAAYLRTEEWLRCRDYRLIDMEGGLMTNSSAGCFLIDHGCSRTWSWNQWYSKSSALLQDECDCSRGLRFNPKTTYENRFFQTESPYGSIKVTFLQNFDNSVKFHSAFPPLSPWNSANSTRCLAGNCSQAPDLDLNTREVLLEMIPKLRPTHLFANTGWGHEEGDTPEKFGCDLQTFQTQNPGVSAVAISSPWRMGSDLERVPPHGCDAKVFDRLTPTLGVPKTWYWDNIHSLSIVNQELNHMMLDMICDDTPEDEGSESSASLRKRVATNKR